MASHGEKQSTFSSKWIPVFHIGRHMVIMQRYYHSSFCYAPFYIFTCSIPDSKLSHETQQILNEYSDFHLIPHTSGKLRWLRCQRDLYQEEVSAYIGLDRGTYANYETPSRTSYPIDKLQKLAQLYQVPVTELMDEYNLFLFHGQGQQLSNLRKHLGFTQKKFALLLGVSRNTFFRWEHDQKTMQKNTWLKIHQISQTEHFFSHQKSSIN